VTALEGYLLFDDTVGDKNYSFAIELAMLSILLKR
jgi:hypothetical protein